MGRPAGWQWQPLGLDTDPVPGDPGQISQEAQHLASVASQITDQVAMLRQIAASNDEVGKHADKIRSSAGDLANQLGKVIGRYTEVSSALNGWIPELEQAQSMSIQALQQAEGPYQQLNQQVLLPGGNHLTAQQQQQVQDYHNSMRRAQGELDAAIALLNRATSLRDSQGSYYAGLINQACDDGVKDSWWDEFKDWVSEWAWLIKDICTGLEILATILAVLALIFSGVGWIVLLGVALTAVALAGRVMLAVTGNGSWFDVAMDVVALLSFGAGSVMTKVLGKVVDAMADTAKGMETAEVASLLDKFGDVAGDAAKQRVLAKFLEKAVPVVEDEAKTTLTERLLGAGDREVVNMMKTVTGLSEKFGDSPAIKVIADQAKMFQGMLRTNFVVANAASAFSLGGGGIEFDGPNGPTAVNWHIPVVGNWYQGTIENGTTEAGGLSTGTANALVDVTTATQPEIGLPLQGFRWALSTF
jgi:hypothetical protein